MKDAATYLKDLEKRGKESHVYRKYQALGLEIAKALDDNAHKALYIKLAKERDGDELLRLAKSIAEKTDVAKKGAYFMACLSPVSKMKKSKTNGKRKYPDNHK